jgi:hypothetical protein
MARSTARPATRRYALLLLLSLFPGLTARVRAPLRNEMKMFRLEHREEERRVWKERYKDDAA